MNSKASYTDFLDGLSQNNPCIDGLAELVKRPGLSASTVVLLEYSAVGAGNAPLGPPAPRHETLNEAELPTLFEKVSDSVSGRILLIENIRSGLVELLGRHLDVDPMFFASYIKTDFQGIDQAPPNPSLAFYPSQIAERGHLHLHYQQVVDLSLEAYPDGLKDSVYLLQTQANVPRNTRRLPGLSNRQLALTRGCCSILVKKLGRIWYGEYIPRSLNTLVLPTLLIVQYSPHPHRPARQGFARITKVRG